MDGTEEYPLFLTPRHGLKHRIEYAWFIKTLVGKNILMVTCNHLTTDISSMKRMKQWGNNETYQVVGEP